jgi:hypothetical protein
MAGGALIQLVAYGAQDVYLTGNPQITFFKLIYRRHTNFAMEWVRQKDMNSNGKFGKRMEVVIERVGDLLGSMHLEVSVPPLLQQQPGLDANGNQATSTWVGFCNSFMHAAVRSVEMLIGGQSIDKQYGDWLEIWSEISLDEGKQYGYRQMVGKYYSDQSLRVNALPTTCRSAFNYRLPFQFWFNRHPGLFLPLLALQYHEVRFIIDLRPPVELIRSDVNIRVPLDYTGKVWDAMDISLWANYIYLDVEERRKFVTQSHEMLIEQLQYNTTVGLPDSAENFMTRMEFNHPLKEINWVVPDATPCLLAGNSLIGNDYFTYSPNIYDTFEFARFIFNGNDRFEAKKAEYFRNAQNYEYHSRTPKKFVYTYSFALKPEEFQPSGTCNASRLDDISFHLTFDTTAQCLNTNRELRMYARNYNILRIMNGQGGLVFSN